jgi:hypothetical protein
MPYMLNNSRVEVFPSLVRTKDRRGSQERSIKSFNAWPSHELTRHETLHEVAVRGLACRCEYNDGQLTNAAPVWSERDQRRDDVAYQIAHCCGVLEQHSTRCVQGP